MDEASFHHLPLPKQLFILDGISSDLSSFSSITHLFIFNISENDLPPNLTHLTVYNTFIGQLPPPLRFAEIEILESPLVSFPFFLSHLYIGRHDHFLPPFPFYLTYLKLSCHLFYPFPFFPLTLEYIDLFYSPYPLPPLPSSLTSISVISILGQCISSLSPLPPSLTSLELRPSNSKHYFFFPFKLPQNLKKITTTSRYSFDYSLLSSNIEHIDMSGHICDSHKILKLPNLKKLRVQAERLTFTSFHSSLTHLYLESFISYLSLPPNLTHLTFTSYRSSFPSLPLTLTHLKFGYIRRIHQFPPSLLFLSFGNTDHPFPPFPSSLQTLECGLTFNDPLSNLPLSLTSLTLGTFYNNSVSFPPFLKRLELGERFNQIINNFPKSLMWMSCQEEWYVNHVNKIPSLCYVIVRKEKLTKYDK